MMRVPWLKADLLLRKLAFRLTPANRRVRLEIASEGRHVTFLIRSLHAAGFALHVPRSPVVFGDLLGLRRSNWIPFSTAPSSPPCQWVIADTQEALERGGEPNRILLNYDFFNAHPDLPRMPYFIHPAIYRLGLDTLPVPPVTGERKVRIGFFGTRDATFYTRRFHFPMLDRESILADFLERHRDEIWRVDAPVARWQPRRIAVSVDDRGGDRASKAFLPLPEYLKALRECDFFLSPPGWCMPLSHNLIEGMAAGCIPILNCPEFLDPPLVSGVHCLTFDDVDGMERAIDTALAMAPAEVEAMRRRVMADPETHLRAGPWLEGVMGSSDPFTEVMVNAEEVSMEILRPGGDFTPEMAS